ncbi:CD209 antigen-like protein D [Merluccius polli]|uniref:CD209 antigen-like protein D n=1 Tax=Merluccius polli TaxID=89951 RepID=A0AA47M5E7_MERPO|nr:CD209 antigen-like protein D [Merluccius polli]
MDMSRIENYNEEQKLYLLYCIRGVVDTVEEERHHHHAPKKTQQWRSERSCRLNHSTYDTAVEIRTQLQVKPQYIRHSSGDQNAAAGEFTRLGWMYYNHRLYFISTAEKNWTASRDDCLERDADLVVINSREEQTGEFILDLDWTECRRPRGDLDWTECRRPRGDLEVGGWYHHDFKVRLVTLFSSISSLRVAEWHHLNTVLHFLFFLLFSFWRRGEPNDYGGEDCVATLLGDNWNDKPCADQYHWICEKVLVLDHLEAELNKEGL